MGQPATLHSFYAGMARDSSRDQLPAGYLWNLEDYIPNYLGSPLRKRGGWTYACSAISGVSGIQRVLYNQRSTGNSLWAIDSASSTTAGPGVWAVDLATGGVSAVGSITAGSAASAGPSSNGYTGIGKGVFIDNKWIVPVGSTDKSQTWAVPFVLTPGGFDVVTGLSSDETGWKVAEVYKSRVVLGNSGSNSRRIRFSGGDPTDFTDTASWIDTNDEIIGMCSLPNVLLIMSTRATYRIRGSTPPTTSGTDEDMILDKLDDVGCIDPRSISPWHGKAIWADTLSVWVSDGFTVSSLTDNGNMGTYWRTLMSNLPTFEVTGVVYRDFYFLTVLDAPGGTFQECLVCDLRKRAWFRFKNFPFRTFSEAKAAIFQDLYAGCANTNRVAKVSDIFDPTSANKSDADGTTVLPVVEYPAQRGYRQLRRKWITNEGLAHWKRVYMTYDMRAVSGDDPTLEISYVNTPEATSYTAIPLTLPETTVQSRAGRSFGPSGARGGRIVPTMAFKIAQTGASEDTRLYTLQGEYEAVEESRLAQT